MDAITIRDANPNTTLMTIFIVTLRKKGLSEGGGDGNDVGCARGRWVNASARTVRTKSTAEGTGRFGGSVVCTGKMVRLVNVHSHCFLLNAIVFLSANLAFVFVDYAKARERGRTLLTTICRHWREAFEAVRNTPPTTGPAKMITHYPNKRDRLPHAAAVDRFVPSLPPFSMILSSGGTQEFPVVGVKHGMRFIGWYHGAVCASQTLTNVKAH